MMTILDIHYQGEGAVDDYLGHLLIREGEMITTLAIHYLTSCALFFKN